MNGTSIQPYLFFCGRCEEALAFYRTALGAEVDVMLRYRESPVPPEDGQLPPGFDDKIMHASFRIGGAVVMASDGNQAGGKIEGFKLALALPSESAAQQAFTALTEGGNVELPLGKTFWSPCFGMVTDRFGVAWMVTVAQTMDT